MSGGLYKSNSQLIAALFRLSRQLGYKKSWVAFEFERQSYEPTLDDFQQLGRGLGYKEAWAEIKYENYYKTKEK